MYPSRYQLPELSAHVVALLERRRQAFETWDEATETALRAEATAALADAHRQFTEIADDEGHWERTERALLTVALPRYFRLAKAQHELERRAYGTWRGGDLVSRVAYAAVGLVLGLIILRTAIPNWLEPLPLLLFLFGPLLPDAQAHLGKRRYAKALAHLVDEMHAEATQGATYLPFGVDEGDPRKQADAAPRDARDSIKR